MHSPLTNIEPPILPLFRRNLHQVAAGVPIQPLLSPILKAKGIEAWVRRDDLIHPDYSGNKFYKLYYNLRNAKQLGAKTLVSFGGYYSNHLHALAAAGRDMGLTTVGLVRGQRPKVLSPTLSDAEHWGMRLLFLPRKAYSRAAIRGIVPILKSDYGNYLLIPQGGNNLAGVRGSQVIACDLAKKLANQRYCLCAATATGTTLAGLVAGTPASAQVLGISVLKGENRISRTVSDYLALLGQQRTNWTVLTKYHQGGYAKVNGALLTSMLDFENLNKIQLEPVYTAKLVLAVQTLAEEDYWRPGTKLVLIHSGGLQGKRGFLGALNAI